ncbi:MAG: hypothetical protein Q8P93_02380 [bacterium]|nr:hypothetical protein [bacterium]
MVNLLSEQQKKAQAYAYKKRFAGLVLVALSSVLFVAILLVGPFVFEYTNAKDVYEIEIARIHDVLATIDTAAEESVLSVRKPLLQGAHEVLSRRPYSSVVEYILSASIGSTRVLSIVMKNTQTVQVHGEAPTRQALVLFADRLRATDGIAHVDVPIANFIEGVDAPFSISFTLDTYENKD